MDAYFKYVKELHAGGYTPDQITGLLLKQGLTVDQANVLLSTLPTNQPAQYFNRLPSAPATLAKASDLYFEKLIEQARDLKAAGKDWMAIDKTLKMAGVDSITRNKIYHLTFRDVSLESSLNQAGQGGGRAKPFVYVKKPTELTLTPTSIAKKQQSSGNDTEDEKTPSELEKTETELVEVADHLSEVADHLSAVADKLTNSNGNLSPPSPPLDSSTERELQSDTKHLATVADHLSNITYSLSNNRFTPNFGGAIPITNSNIPLVTNSDSGSGVMPYAGSTPMAGLGAVTAREKQGMMTLVVFIIALGSSVLISSDKKTIWLSLLGLNVVGTVGFNLLLRRLEWTHINDWFTAAVLQTGLMLPFLIREFAKPIQYPPIHPFVFLLLGIAIAALISLQYCNVKALKNLEASVFSVVFNTRILFATILASFFLGELNSRLNLIGGFLIFIAIFIIRQKGKRELTINGLVFGLCAALSMSIMNTCEKELIKLIGYDQYIFPMFTIAAIIMWLIVFIRRHKVRIPMKLIASPQSLLLMTLRACAGIGFSYSLVFGPVAVSSYISSLSVVLLVVFGMLFLGEIDYIKAKISATVTAIIGLTFILIGSG